MRLLRCLLMIMATLAMTVHVTAASMTHEGRVRAGIVQTYHHPASHHRADTARHVQTTEIADAAHHCTPGHHHKKSGCCDALCCSSPCIEPMMVASAFARVFRSAQRRLPAPDLMPTGASRDRLIRPPISA